MSVEINVELNLRIKKIRDNAGLSQRAFGDTIGVSGASVAKYELGTNNPSEQTIRAICSEFRVNRLWLETGEGDPYIKPDRQINLAQEIRDILKDEHPMMIAVMASLASMDSQWWDTWAKKLHEEVEKLKKGDG